MYGRRGAGETGRGEKGTAQHKSQSYYRIARTYGFVSRVIVSYSTEQQHFTTTTTTTTTAPPGDQQTLEKKQQRAAESESRVESRESKSDESTSPGCREQAADDNHHHHHHHHHTRHNHTHLQPTHAPRASERRRTDASQSSVFVSTRPSVRSPRATSRIVRTVRRRCRNRFRHTTCCSVVNPHIACRIGERGGGEA